MAVPYYQLTTLSIGSRDPHMLSGQGAGFALEWKGNPKFTIGHSPEDKELLQLRSKQMYLTIPE